MPRGRSTSTKRHKEQARQQKQREKAARKSERKQERPEASLDEMREMQEHAAAQAALFRIGLEEPDAAESSSPQSEKNAER
jgi:hypothetical protein